MLVNITRRGEISGNERVKVASTTSRAMFEMALFSVQNDDCVEVIFYERKNLNKPWDPRGNFDTSTVYLKSTLRIYHY